MLLTIGPGGCGFSFLNWSIMYLRGDKTYQTLDGTQWPVTSNPLLNSTAHNYKKDHLRIDDCKTNFNHATENSIIYAVPGSQHNFEYLLGFPGKKIIFDTSNYSRVLMARAILCMPQHAQSNFYTLIEDLSQTYDRMLVREVLLSCHKLFTQYYQLPDSSYDHYRIDYPTVFNNLDNVVSEIFDYLEINVDTSRQAHWQSIYNTYKQANQRDFCAEVAPVVGKDTTQKTQILKEILKWRNGLSLRT